MATPSSILAWRIPWTEEPGRLQYIGSQSQTRMKRLSMHPFRELRSYMPRGAPKTNEHTVVCM